MNRLQAYLEENREMFKCLTDENQLQELSKIDSEIQKQSSKIKKLTNLKDDSTRLPRKVKKKIKVQLMSSALQILVLRHLHYTLSIIRRDVRTPPCAGHANEE